MEFLTFPKILFQYSLTQDAGTKLKCVLLMNQHQVVHPGINHNPQFAFNLEHNIEVLTKIESQVELMLTDNHGVELKWLQETVVPKFMIGLEFKRAVRLLNRIAMEKLGSVDYDFELQAWIFIFTMYHIWFGDVESGGIHAAMEVGQFESGVSVGGRTYLVAETPSVSITDASGRGLSLGPVGRLPQRSSNPSTHKSILNTCRKLELLINKYQFKSPHQLQLITLVRLFNILYHFKTGSFGEIDPRQFEMLTDLNLLHKELPFFYTEALLIFVLFQLLTVPFNNINLSPPVVNHLILNGLSDVVALVDHLKRSKYYSSNQEQLNLWKFYFPRGYNDLPEIFLSYFGLILKFKLFLNLMTFTSKVSKSQIILLVKGSDDDVEKFVLLIAALNLSAIGIGYDIADEVFYNNGTESVAEELNYNVRKLSSILNDETRALTLKKSLVDNF